MTERGFVWKGKTLLSGIDPAGRARRIADAVPIYDRTLYLCPSPLFGGGLDRLLERLARDAPNSAVLCVEADKALYDLAVQSIGPRAAGNKMLRITNDCNAEALCVFARQNWGARSFRRVEVVRLTGGWQLFPELYNSLAGALRRVIAVDWGNALTLSKLGRRYMRNALRNLALIPRHPSIAELSFGSSPVLVLGAGPSADSLLDGLERRFGGALHNQAARPFKIICVDTCLPALRDRNIPPDLAVILESQHWNLRDFIGSRGRQIPAAMDLSALPATGEILSGGLFLFMTPWTPLRIFDRLKAAISMPAEMPPLGSVGLCATELGRRLTRGMIIVAGLDFSFTPDSYHARSTPGHQDKLRRLNRLQSPLNAEAAFASAAFAAESKSGLPVRSNPAMRNYRALFEQEFAGDGRLCDIPGSGLPLGIRTIPPDKAFDLLAAGASGDGTEQCPAALQAGLSGKLRMFLLEEKNRLTMLRDILSGSAAAGGSAGSPTGSAHLETLVDEYDCLWAHFPDYAAAGGRRPDAAQIAAASPAALSFLKRLRAEIDPALALLEMTLQELPV